MLHFDEDINDARARCPDARHWLDDLVGRVQTHIVWITSVRDDLMAQCLPPADFFAHVDAMQRGATFNQLYTTILTKQGVEEARVRCEAGGSL